MRGAGRLLVVAVATGLVGVGSAGADDEIPFDEADLFFELNDSDGDLGLHSNLDGEGWRRLVIEAPNERTLLDIRARSKLRRQGLTQLMFESAEPTFDELAPEKFFRRFPEGTYEIEGITVDGLEMESEAEVTHLLPSPASGIVASGTSIVPEDVDCDDGPLPLVTEPVVISWDPVMLSHPELGRTDEPIEVVRYQLVVEQDDLVYSVELTPDVTVQVVPETFTLLADEFKLEILVKEESGNQTAVESCFELDR